MELFSPLQTFPLDIQILTLFTNILQHCKDAQVGTVSITALGPPLDIQILTLITNILQHCKIAQVGTVSITAFNITLIWKQVRNL